MFDLFNENDKKIAESEKKYDSYLQKLNDVEALYEHDVISEEEYTKFKVVLESELEGIEGDIYPYITEAANAISVSLLDTEIKELSNPKKDKKWIKQRLNRFEKYTPDLIPFKKLKAKSIKQDELDKRAKDIRRELKFNKELKNPRNFSLKQYYYDGKPVIAYMKYAKGKYKNKKITCMTEVFDPSLKKYNYYYHECTDYGLSKDFVKMAKKIALDEKRKLEKVVKESVIEEFEQNYSLDQMIESVDDAIIEGVIGEAVGTYYKDFIKGIHEKVMLDASLHKI